MIDYHTHKEVNSCDNIVTLCNFFEDKNEPPCLVATSYDIVVSWISFMLL